MEIKNIQWFPGHMAKTRRMIKENLSLVDGVVEILDARIPFSSKNPEMDRLINGKPRMFLLNKSDLADTNVTNQWIDYYKKLGVSAVLPIDCKSGKGLKLFLPTLKSQVLNELISKRENKGMVGVPLKIMIVGIPNVGKSSFINKMAGGKRAKVEDRPGVTRTKQWVRFGENVEMLDMPGVLWPKFEDQTVAQKLAFTGAVKDDVIDLETLSMMLLETLSQSYPKSLIERYKIEISPTDDGMTLLQKVGKKRGMLISGGEVNIERASIMVMDEFRGGKLGKITLETPKSIILD
ncbi:MAG: ribosome biogenesis GTPase YlqF [Oscillospiraceae bacterium]